MERIRNIATLVRNKIGESLKKRPKKDQPKSEETENKPSLLSILISTSSPEDREMMAAMMRDVARSSFKKGTPSSISLGLRLMDKLDEFTKKEDE